jgi:circadian clock protein KaiB
MTVSKRPSGRKRKVACADDDVHHLRLYVAGITPRSVRAVENLKQICELDLAGEYELEIIDIYKHPGRASEDQIVAVPTLIDTKGGRICKMIGDLSERSRVRTALGLPPNPPS